MSNLAEILATTVEQHSDQIAVELDDIKLNYAVVDQASARAAGLLRAAGVGPGDRVGIMLPNVPVFPVPVLRGHAPGRRGGADEPAAQGARGHVPPRRLGREHDRRLAPVRGGGDERRRRRRREVILVEPGKFEELLGAAEPVTDIADRADDDTALILYTSGTTGTPKGAELTHGNLRAAAEIAVELVDADASSVTLGALPLFHVFGLTSGLNSARAGRRHDHPAAALRARARRWRSCSATA